MAVNKVTLLQEAILSLTKAINKNGKATKEQAEELKKRKINNSNDPIEVKNERKKRLRRNAQLGSIPFYKWIVIILRSPKAILDNISS